MIFESGIQQCCRCGWPFHPSENGYLSGGTIDDQGMPFCTFCIKFAGGLRMEKNLEAVKERIRRCLALGSSPNEAEALLALTKARELMAKYKLTVEDIGVSEDVTEDRMDFTFTKQIGWWISDIGAVISERYGCRILLETKYRKKTYRLKVIGMKADSEACRMAISAAVTFVMARIAELGVKRKTAYSYGLGFATGLKKAYAESDRKHPEYALVMTTPQKVTERLEKVTKKTAEPKPDIDMDLFRQGVVDGSESLRGKLQEVAE